MKNKNIEKIQKRKSAQDIQDEIFRKMPVGRKIELGVKFWQLAKEISNNKIIKAKYEAYRS